MTYMEDGAQITRINIEVQTPNGWQPCVENVGLAGWLLIQHRDGYRVVDENGVVVASPEQVIREFIEHEE